MTAPESDKVFGGSMADVYERHLVPLIFEPYARDLVKRIVADPGREIVEIAAGTGALTREMARRLPAGASIVATDLNQGMLAQAAGRGTARPVSFRLADAMHLPFPDQSADTIVCSSAPCSFRTSPRPSPRHGVSSVRAAGCTSACGTGLRRTHSRRR
jgi:SAM-dependent methyltransferase